MDRINKNNKNNEWKEIKAHLYGLDEKESLQSVHFAKTENRYVDEYSVQDSEE